jgi:hypothetical protein
MSRVPLRGGQLRSLPRRQRRPTPSIGTAEWPNQRVEPWTIQPKRCDDAARPALMTFALARRDDITACGETRLGQWPAWVDEVEVRGFVVGDGGARHARFPPERPLHEQRRAHEAETCHRKPLCRRRSAADCPPVEAVSQRSTNAAKRSVHPAPAALNGRPLLHLPADQEEQPRPQRRRVGLAPGRLVS